LNSFFITALHQYGYPALWAVVFIAAVGAPISGNLLLYAAGAFAAFGDFNIFLLLPVAVSAAVLGDNLGYFIGWKLGNPLLTWLERKRWRFIPPEAIARGRSYFRRRASWAIFLSRWLIVVLGGPINWLAGAECYSYRSFLFWDISGQLLGAIIPLSVGYIFAASWGEAESLFGSLSGFVLAFLVALIISAALFRRMRARKRARLANGAQLDGQQQRQASSHPALPEQDAERQRASLSLPEDEISEMSCNKPTILILISRSGGGHLNLAQALKERLNDEYTVVIVDPQSPRVERGYTLVSRHFVRLLTWQFALTDNKIAAWLLQKSLAQLSYKRFSRIVEELQPQIIITTHALVSAAAVRANETSARPVPLIFQLTDLESLHMTWFVEKRADAYLAPTKEIFEQALRQGIERDRLHLTGRPARRQFYETTANEREKTLSALGLDPRLFTLFLQGGAQGSAGADRLIAHILSTKLPAQIILAAGNNQEMAARYASTERVHVLPFTEQIAPYMAAADIVAGKAGASFITEALLLEKPFMVTSFIPGQETPNLRFIERHNLGWVCLEIAEQQKLLAKLASNSEMIAEKVRCIQKYRAWNIEANQAIAPLIARLLL
jgi:UDP-N-acetylglucosamine:LPS N-acetylglucosamine transferase/membrane protein DedA with SNARE-associated domain